MSHPRAWVETLSGEQLDAVVEGVRSAIDALAADDLATCDRVGLDAVLTQWRVVRIFTDVVEVRIARRARELAAEGCCERPEGISA